MKFERADVKNNLNRSIAVGVMLVSCTPFIYLACAIRAFRQDSTVVDPWFEGIVDCLESPVGQPLELLLQASGVNVDNLHCAKHERGCEWHRSETSARIEPDRADVVHVAVVMSGIRNEAVGGEEQNFRYYLHEDRREQRR